MVVFTTGKDVVAKPKLTEKQWNKIKERLDAGEKAAALAREYGVTRAAITNKFSVRKKAVNELANQIVSHHKSLQNSLQQFTPDIQIEAWDVASDLITISKHVGAGSKFGAMTFHRLAGIANLHAQRLDDDNPDPEQLMRIAQLTKVGNEAAAPALNLLAANKDRIKQADDQREAEAALIHEIELIPLLPDEAQS